MLSPSYYLLFLLFRGEYDVNIPQTAPDGGLVKRIHEQATTAVNNSFPGFGFLHR